MNTSTLYFVVFILMSAAVFFFLRLDFVLLDWITSRAERKAKIKSFKKQSKFSKRTNTLINSRRNNKVRSVRKQSRRSFRKNSFK